MLKIEEVADDLYSDIVKWSRNNIFMVVPDWEQKIVDEINLFDNKVEKIRFLNLLHDRLAEITGDVGLIKKYSQFYSDEDEVLQKFMLISDIIQFIDKKKEILRKNNERSETNQNKLVGFESSLTDEQVEALYKEIQNTYIDTTLNNFREIFNPQQLSNNFKPIERKKKFTNALLIYFTCELFYNANKSDYVSITEKCFTKAKNLSQTQSLYFNNKGGNNNDERKPIGHRYGCLSIPEKLIML